MLRWSPLFLALSGVGFIASEYLFRTPPLATLKSVPSGVGPRLGQVLPEINFAGQGLEDVLDFLSDVTGMKIVADWPTLEAAGLNRDAPATAQLKNLPLHEALSAILNNVGGGNIVLGYAEAGDMIVISTVEGINQLPRPFIRRTGPSTMPMTPVELALARRVFSDPDSTKLRLFLTRISDEAGIRIDVDWTALMTIHVNGATPTHPASLEWSRSGATIAEVLDNALLTDSLKQVEWRIDGARIIVRPKGKSP